MLLKEYLDELNKMVKKDKTLLDCRVICAKDDEVIGFLTLLYSIKYIFHIEVDLHDCLFNYL